MSIPFYFRDAPLVSVYSDSSNASVGPLVKGRVSALIVPLTGND